MYILRLQKPVGLTPIQFWLDYRSRNFLPNMDAIESQRLPKGAICGKLDPLAEGEMIVLISEWPKFVRTEETNHLSFIPNLEDFGSTMDSLSNCEKVYEFGLLLGISTESDDRLGLLEDWHLLDPEKDKLQDRSSEITAELILYANNLVEQQYHVFSAKRAHNKENLSQPLWWWKKNNRLDEVVIPRHPCKIKQIEIISGTETGLSEFVDKTIDLLSQNSDNLKDFEVESIIASWSKLKNLPNTIKLPIINVRCRVTGGTFIRQICRDLISRTGIPMVCTYIDRKSIIIPS